MTTPTGERKARYGSLRRQLIDYFEANPGEDLTTEDIVTKFDAEKRLVRNTIYNMRQAGEIWSGFVVRRKA